MRGARPTVLGGFMAIALAMITGGPVAAADPSLRIEPSVVKVAEGAEFTVRVVQDAPGPVSGAQASIIFDHTILQIASVTRGAAYEEAPIVVPQDLTTAVISANQGGRLAQVASAFLPPASVPSGPAEFLVVRFRAIGCGATALDLPAGPEDATMIDGRQETYGDPITITAAGSQVTTCVAAGDVTPTGDERQVSAKRDGGAPLALLAIAAGLVIVATIGGLARRSRRRRQPE